MSPRCSCSTRPSAKGHGPTTPLNTARLGPLVGGSNIDSPDRPDGCAARHDPIVVRLDYLDLAADRLCPVRRSSGATGPDGVHRHRTRQEIIMSGQTGDEGFVARYRTPWITADWPTRKKSWRRADYVCRISGRGYDLAVESFRDYEERNVARRHTVTVPPSGAGAIWGQFTWGDGTLWGEGGPKRGAMIRRGSQPGDVSGVAVASVGGAADRCVFVVGCRRRHPQSSSQTLEVRRLMALIIPNSIDNDTPADAAELQQNFTTIQTYVNTNLLHRDGSVALTPPLLLPGDPTQDNHAANKGYVDGRDALKVQHGRGHR